MYFLLNSPRLVYIRHSPPLQICSLLPFFLILYKSVFFSVLLFIISFLYIKSLPSRFSLLPSLSPKPKTQNPFCLQTPPANILSSNQLAFPVSLSANQLTPLLSQPAASPLTTEAGSLVGYPGANDLIMSGGERGSTGGQPHLTPASPSAP